MYVKKCTLCTNKDIDILIKYNNNNNNNFISSIQLIVIFTCIQW